MKDDFRRAQFNGKGSYCSCCDIHPDRCPNSGTMRGRVHGKLKRWLRKLLREEADVKERDE